MIGGRGNAEVAFQALIEVVAGFGSRNQNARSGEGAVDMLGDESALHPLPQQVELGVVGDQASVFEDRLEWTEIVAGGSKVNCPDRSTLAAKREQADVALPRIKPIAFALNIGFDVQSNAACSRQVGGNAVEVAAEGAENPSGGHEDIWGDFPIPYIETF